MACDKQPWPQDSPDYPVFRDGSSAAWWPLQNQVNCWKNASTIIMVIINISERIQCEDHDRLDRLA